MNDLRFWVPCCPHCSLPLRPTEDDDTRGICPSLWCPAKGDPVSREGFAWIHQDVFNQSELPPFCGWEPIRLEGM